MPEQVPWKNNKDTEPGGFSGSNDEAQHKRN